MRARVMFYGREREGEGDGESERESVCVRTQDLFL